MDVKSAIREVMMRKDVGTSALASRIGGIPRLVSDRLSSERSKSISVSTVNEMLRAMDYKIVIMPRETRMGADWIEVE